MSNLTVSYVSQTPAVSTTAGVTAAAPAADGPLGFLAALVDQLLTGGAEAVQGEIAAKTGAQINVPGLVGMAIDATQTAATPEVTNPLSMLGTQLGQLATTLKNGEAPSSAQLQDLTAAITALGDALDAAPATTTSTDATASITTSTELTRTSTPAISNDEIVDLLAKLGLIEPPQKDTAAKPTPVAAYTDPVVDLVDRLTTLSQTLAATAPAIADKLTALATKIEAKPEVAAELGLVAQPETDTDTATIAHIIRTLLGHETKSTPDDPRPAQDAAAGPSSTDDDLLKILATLGINVPPATSTGVPVAEASAGAAATTAGAASVTAAAPAATAVPAPLLRLSNQLSKVGAELASTAPELAKKLEAVATQMTSATADPELLGRLTSAATQPSGTSLDRLVQSLIDPKPATVVAIQAAPQISAPADLTLPAPLAPKEPKSAVAEVKAAPPVSDTATVDSAQPAPRVAITATTADAPADNSAEPKAETKVAAIAADTSKSDQPAQQTPTQPQTVPVAPQHARVLPAAYQAVANPINMGQVAFEMARQVQQGSSRFTIRLDPPELGRVDVKMHVDATGAVNARLTVDRAETLDLFQRDRQSLERALSQAGLDTSKTNLEFSLRQQNQNPFAGMMGGDQRQQQPNYGNTQRFASNDTDDVAAMPAITLYRGTASAAGVNIFA